MHLISEIFSFGESLEIVNPRIVSYTCMWWSVTASVWFPSPTELGPCMWLANNPEEYGLNRPIPKKTKQINMTRILNSGDILELHIRRTGDFGQQRDVNANQWCDNTKKPLNKQQIGIWKSMFVITMQSTVMDGYLAPHVSEPHPLAVVQHRLVGYQRLRMFWCIMSHWCIYTVIS